MLNKQSKKLNLSMFVNNGKVKYVYDQEDTVAKEESKVKQIAKVENLKGDATMNKMESVKVDYQSFLKINA